MVEAGFRSHLLMREQVMTPSMVRVEMGLRETLSWSMSIT